MKKFLFDKVNSVIIQRKKILDEQFTKASLTNGSALKLKNEYEEALKSSTYLSEQIVADAKERAKVEYEKIVKEANEESIVILNKAKENVKMEHHKALRKMKGEITELVIDATTKIVGKKNMAERNLELYDQFLVEAGELDGTSS